VRQAYSAEVSYEGRERLRPCWTTFFQQARNPWEQKQSWVNFLLVLGIIQHIPDLHVYASWVDMRLRE
jgi:hypothetical protein